MSQIYNYKKSVFVLVAALVFVSCSPKQSTRKRSYSDTGIELQINEPSEKKLNSELQKLELLLAKVEPVVVSEMAAINVDASRMMGQVIIPLKEVLLDTNYMLDPKVRYARTDSGRYVTSRLLALFNESILLVYKENPHLIQSTDLLQKYKETLFWDCDRKLRGSCDFIQFYRTSDSTHTSQVIKLIHDNTENESEKLRLILAGFDIKNRRVDSALRFMLLERIAKSLDLEGAGSISPSRKKEDADLFANIFKINIDEFAKDKKYLALVKSLNPWKLSRKVDSGKNPAMTDIIKMASEQMLYEEDGSLNKDIKNKIIPELLYVIGPNFEQGPKFQEANIRGQWKKPYESYKKAKQIGETPTTLTTLQEKVFPQIDNALDLSLYNDTSKGILDTLLKGVSYGQKSLDEYFYLAHYAFYGHFNLDDATAFWSNSHKNVDRLMDEVEKIIKTQIVNNIVLTNNRMNDFYNRNENSKLVELLRESDKEASKIRKAWSTTIVRSKIIKSFVTRVVNPNSLTFEQKKKFDRINSSVDALTKNIKFLVTYPNMFPLMHVMASLEMKDTIRSYFGTFTIDSISVIDWFFAGRFPPWFNFGNDGEPLDPTEIIYTYYYALVTQIFETYSTNTLVSFKHEDFFKVVVKKLILEEEKTLDEDRRYLAQKTQEFKNNAQALERICSEEKRLQKLEAADLAKLKNEIGDKYSWYRAMKWRKVMRPRSQIKNQIAFVDLYRGVYDATDTREDKIGNYINTIYSSSVSDVFEEMRQNFPAKNAIAQTLVDVFKSTKKGDQQTIDDLVKEQYQEYNRLKADYVATYTTAEKQVSGCDWAFLKRDRDIRHLLIFREAEELGKLFEKTWSLLKPLSVEERDNIVEGSDLFNKLDEIRKGFGSFDGQEATQNPHFPEVYRKRYGYNKLTASRLTLFAMDTNARVLLYLDELFPGEYAITMPPDFKDTNMYQESNPELVYFDWSLDDKEAAKRAFIQSGIKAFANKMLWVSNETSISSLADKGDILVNLFKLGMLSRDVDVDCLNPELSKETKDKACFKISAKEIIDHYKKTIHFLNLDDRDLDVLALLGKENKYSESIYESYIKKKDEHVLYSFYDLIFKRVFSDQDVDSSEAAWFSSTLIQYVDSMHKINGSTFIFPYSSNVNEIFIKKYSEWLNEYYARNKEFLVEVKEQLSKGVEPFKFMYRTDRQHTIGVKSYFADTNSEINLEPLVSDLIFGKLEGLSQKLDNDTSGYFSELLNKYSKEFKDLAAEGSQ